MPEPHTDLPYPREELVYRVTGGAGRPHHSLRDVLRDVLREPFEELIARLRASEGRGEWER